MIIARMDFDPRALVADCVRMVSGKVRERGLALKYDIHDNVPTVVKGDA